MVWAPNDGVKPAVAGFDAADPEVEAENSDFVEGLKPDVEADFGVSSS